MWPETEPRDLYGPAVQEPDLDPVHIDTTSPIWSREELEESYVAELNGNTVCSDSETARDFVAWREEML